MLSPTSQVDWKTVIMEPACRKDKPKLNSTPTRGDRAKQKSAQQELKQRQRAEVTSTALLKLSLTLNSTSFTEENTASDFFCLFFYCFLLFVYRFMP